MFKLRHYQIIASLAGGEEVRHPRGNRRGCFH